VYGTSEGGIKVSDQLIDPAELGARLAALRRELAPAGEQVIHIAQTGSPTDLSRRLRAIADRSSDRSLVRSPGPRGYFTFSVKRVVRRLTAWYVEPLHESHADLAASVADLALDTLARLDDLERRVGALQAENRRLVHEHRQLTSGPRPELGGQ